MVKIGDSFPVLLVIAVVGVLLLVVGGIVLVRRFLPDRSWSSLAGTTQRNVVYRTVNGTAVKMDIYFPRTMGDDPLPIVVYVHGGGWIAGNKNTDVGQLDIVGLVDNGYIAASIDYRLAPDYRFPAQIEDAKCAIRFLRANAEKYHLDPNKVGVFGSSAGGHLVALMGVTDQSAGFDVGEYLDQSSRVQAVVDLYGPTDMSILSNNAFTASVRMAVFGTLDTDVLLWGSAVSYVSSDDPPFLIMHGDKDNVVPLNQSVTLYEMLVAAHVPAQLVIVHNAGHSWEPVGGTIDPSRTEITQLIVDFFDQHLKNG
jgi:acetyl esterase/lipase